MKRIPSSEKTRQAIRALLEEGINDGDPRSELMRLAMGLIAEEALEAKVRDLIGRDYYQHGDGGGGLRNGNRQGTLKTAEGRVTFGVPQVRGVDASELSNLRDVLKGRTAALEDLAVEMYARGCSTRDIEEIFRDSKGRLLLSRTAVSELTEALWAEYEEFATRDLSDIKPLYLYVDGIAERLRPGAKREAVLAAWTITWDGSKALLSLSPGTKESTECCLEFLRDLKRRGMEDPIEVVTDGAPGLVRAVDEVFSVSLRQRCLAHKIRNITAKLPSEAIPEVRQAARAAYEAPSPAMARALGDDFVERFGREFPSATKCFQEDFEACIAHLRLPPNHRKVARTTNLLERLFLEERRRQKAALHLFGERPVLKLMYAALVRGAERWRGITVNDFERRQLENLREELKNQHQVDSKPATKPGSTPIEIYSKNRT